MTHLASELTQTVNTTDSSSDELIVNYVTTKEYQTLLDRFRRKPISNNKNEYSNIIVNIESSDSLINDTVDYGYDDNIEREESKVSTDRDVDNSMEKLRVDDATRTKIFHDFFTTVSKYPEKNTNESKTDLDSDFVTEYISVSEMEELSNDSFSSSNESLVSPTIKPLSSRVPNTRFMQTPRPSIDGELNNIIFQTTVNGTIEYDQYDLISITKLCLQIDY